MNLPNTLSLLLLTASLITGGRSLGAGHPAEDPIEAARKTLKADRQATVAEALQLSGEEARAFWPVYHQYRADMDKVGDGIKYLVIEYAELYPDIPNDRAKKMLQQLSDLEEEHVETRNRYLKRVGKLLPATKTLRFAQVESRLDLVVRLELAARIPVVPIEGKIGGRLTQASAAVTGKAGGVIVQTFELKARVIAMNWTARTLTLLGDNGIKETVRVGPEVINFEQIRLGDRLRLVLTEELVVQLAGSGEPVADGGAGVVALAPKGARPGGLMAETTQVTGTVTAIDRTKRTATLKFEDGTTKTLPVRADVDLSQRKVGEKVTVRVTEMIALSVEPR